MRRLITLQQRARQLKAETWALALAVRDPRTPWYAKLLVAGIVAYACSPIDLLPDFVPVLGYLDDLVLLPLGIAWAMQLIPPAVLVEYGHKQPYRMGNLSVGWQAQSLSSYGWASQCLVWCGSTRQGERWSPHEDARAYSETHPPHVTIPEPEALRMWIRCIIALCLS